MLEEKIPKIIAHILPGKKTQKEVRTDGKLTFLKLQTYFEVSTSSVDQWYSTFFVRVPPDIISLQHCTPKVVGT
jgi:hypothetical protein